ncbi:hypothetical protein DRW03_16490 [Corallococcus sp. H22C18031201]|nr:hypothetical protein DRW03_16490 [Corallococcus sp. H22C18031201]
MQSHRRPLLRVLAFSLLCWGCSSSSPTSPPDSGTVTPGWDGTAVPLEEWGDVFDAGTPSACRMVEDAGAGVECGDLATFELSGCDRASLARVPATGIFSGVSGALAMQGDAGTFLVGGPVEQLRREDGTLYASVRYTTKRNAHMRVAFAACEAPTSEQVKGCLVTCREGVFSGLERGDFNQLGKSDGTPEASGGLQRISESFVPLGMPADVYVTHDHAYVVSLDHPHGEGGLTVFDVSDRAHPVLKKVIHLDGDSYWNAVWSKGDTLYVASKAHGVLVFDIHQPADPQLLRAVPGGDPLNVHTLFLDGDLLYAMSQAPTPSILVFDVRAPSAPVLLQRIVIPLPPEASALSYPHDAFAYQGRLYVNHMGDGYVVLDATQPTTSRELGAYRFTDSYSHANALGTFAGRTIAFEGGEGVAAHLRVLDVTDPAHIVKIGEYSLGTYSIHNMILRGTTLYIAYYQEGLRVLDVSNPTQPREIAHYATYRDSDPFRIGDLFEGAIGIRVPGDGFVYLVDTSRGLLVFKEL